MDFSVFIIHIFIEKCRDCAFVLKILKYTGILVSGILKFSNYRNFSNFNEDSTKIAEVFQVLSKTHEISQIVVHFGY